MHSLAASWDCVETSESDDVLYMVTRLEELSMTVGYQCVSFTLIANNTILKKQSGDHLNKTCNFKQIFCNRPLIAETMAAFFLVSISIESQDCLVLVFPFSGVVQRVQNIPSLSDCVRLLRRETRNTVLLPGTTLRRLKKAIVQIGLGSPDRVLFQFPQMKRSFPWRNLVPGAGIPKLTS